MPSPRRGETDTGHHHRLIVDALADRDAIAARAALVADISRPFEVLRRKLRQETSSDGEPT